MQAVEVLRKDHAPLRKGLALLELAMDRMVVDEPLSLPAVGRLLSLFQTLERAHAVKVEGALIPHLEAAIAPRRSALLAAVRGEYDLCRQLLGSLVSAHRRIGRSRRPRVRFVAAACSFLDRFGELLLTEEHMLLRLAEETLSPEADALLVAEFAAIDAAHAPALDPGEAVHLLPLQPASRPGRPGAPAFAAHAPPV